MNGITESSLQHIPDIKACLQRDYGVTIPGSLVLETDSHPPVSGSIKTRDGGPGSMAFGLKHIFGNAAQCFFAELTCIVWDIGGSVVPDEEMGKYYQTGKNIGNC